MTPTEGILPATSRREWLTTAREPRWRALAGAFATVVLAQGLSNCFPVFLLPLSVMLAGAVILGGGVALAAGARSPLALLLWFGGVAGVGAGLLGSVAQLVILSRWFPTARGAVNGVASSGLGLGIFLFAPLAGLLIERIGWRGAMGCLGIGARAQRRAASFRSASSRRLPNSCRRGQPGQAPRISVWTWR